MKSPLKIANLYNGLPEYLELLEKSLLEYPEVSFNNFALGYYYRFLDPEKAIYCFDAASQWLVFLEENSDGYYVPPYMQSLANKMQRLAN